MIITLTGRPGSGKTTVGKLLAKKLNYEHTSVGDLRGQMAAERGLTIDELNEIGKTEDWTDKEADAKTEEIGKTKDNFVIDGWMAWKFIPHSLKIFLDVDMKVAAKRIFLDQRPDEKHQETEDGVFEMISKRWEETTARYAKWYDVDLLDMNNYDLVIDASNQTPEQIVDQILEKVKNFKSNP